jgi:putative ABC transport system permease protein
VTALRLMLRMLVRDLRAGELGVLGVALLIAVSAMTSVSFLADRVQQGLQREAHQLLGGDLLLAADHPWRDEIRDEARRRGLRLAESALFASMASSPEGAQLAEVKAVSPGYPLRGALRIADSRGDIETHEIPSPGTVWPDERLRAGLGLGQGGAVRLGASAMTVSALVMLDPDRGINAFALAPRLLMNLADLPATRLVQPGSRISWRLHLAGERAAVAGFQHWVELRLGRGERLETLDNARPEVSNLLERAQRFLRLAAMLAVVLAAVAVALAAERYMRRHLDGCAVMRCLGASERQLLVIHGGEFVLFGVAMTALGCACGYAVQFVLQFLVGDLVFRELPPPGLLPWLQGVAVGTVLVVGFVLPPLLRLKRVSTLRVLRREWRVEDKGAMAAYVVGMLLLAALVIWVAGELALGGIVLGGFAITLAVNALIARALIGALRGVRAGAGWRYGLASLRRRPQATVLHCVALGLGFTALLLLTVGRGDLMQRWQARVPPDAPNRFVINIQPEQRASVAEVFAARGLPAPVMEPMVRGRLVAVNGRATGPADYAEERAQRLVEREFNLSWSADLPAGNAVTAGQWHGASATAQFSVEQGLAETLHLRLGDALTYEIAGVRISADITSLRKLDWDSMRVNFFVIAPPGILTGQPTSYITSFHLPPAQTALVNDLVRRLPNLTVVDVGALVRQLQETLDQVARAVQLVFGFALLAGVMVLLAALQAGQDARATDLALMRALGARAAQLRAALLAELAALGALAGLLGGFSAAAIAWLLARYSFHLDYVPSVLLPLGGAVFAVCGVCLAGLAGTRALLQRPPAVALRGG